MADKSGGDPGSSRSALFSDEAKAALRETLEAVDEHPVGHMAVELVRAKVQNRKLELTDFFDIIDEVAERARRPK